MSLFGYVSCPRCNGQGHEADDSAVDCLACKGDGFVDENDLEPESHREPSRTSLAEPDR